MSGPGTTRGRLYGVARMSATVGCGRTLFLSGSERTAKENRGAAER